MKATLKHARKLLDLIDDSGKDGSWVQSLIESGLFSDLLAVHDPKCVDRESVKKALGLSLASFDVYSVSIPAYELPFAERAHRFLVANDRSYRESTVNEETCPISHEHAGMVVNLYLFTSKIAHPTEEEVRREMASFDLRPASIQHALAFGERYGKLMITLTFLGSQCVVAGEITHPELGIDERGDWGLYSRTYAPLPKGRQVFVAVSDYGSYAAARR